MTFLSNTGAASSGSNAKVGRVVALLLAFSMLLALPLAPSSEAQGAQFAPSQQQQAAEKLMQQLDSTVGPITMADLTIDPALGPPPWTSFVPDRDPATILAWGALAERIAETETTSALKTAPSRAQTLGAIVAEDIEASQEQGLNDTIETGQFIPGFGTGNGDEPFARVIGNLSGDGGILEPPPPPASDCPSVEPDGSIPDAIPTLINGDDIQAQLCSGFIGDGEFGDSSGDVDFFALNEVAAGSEIILDAGNFDGSPFSVTLAVYSADGVLLASHDDDSIDVDDLLLFVAPETGDYFGAVAGVGTLPSDPFDPSSGGGVSYVGNWFSFAINQPPIDGPPPPQSPPLDLWNAGLTGADGPCESVEDDGAIPVANRVDIEFGEFVQCAAVIGDGPFGDSSGDYDYYTLSAEAGDGIFASIEASTVGSPLDSFLAIFDDSGSVLATNDDFNDLDSQILLPAPFTGDFHVGVFSFASIPEDPFDSGSGPGATSRSTR